MVAGGESGVRVLVTGGEHAGGLAALRALRLAGHEPWAALVEPDAPAARSTMVAGSAVVPDPRSGGREFARTLAEVAERIGAQVVLPGTEACLISLSKHGSEFPQWVAVGAPPPRAVARATDKTLLETLAAAAGIDVPPTFRLERGGDLRAIRLPAVVKPIRSELRIGGALRRVEARRVDTPEELDRALAALPEEAGLVQPFLDGPLITSNGLAWDGEVVAANRQLGHRIWPEHCGSLCYGETIPQDPELLGAVRRLIDDLGWSGLFNLQFIRAGERLHLIDLNPRIYHSLWLAVASGLNLPALWVALLLGRPVQDPGYRAGVRFRSEPEDLRALAAEFGHGSRCTAVAGLLPHARTAHALFSLRDPGPAASEAAKLLAAGVRRLGRRIRA